MLYSPPRDSALQELKVMENSSRMMLLEPVQRLRTSFTLLHRSPEPQEEATRKNAEQGKDTFFRRSIDTATQDLLGHDAPFLPSPRQRTSSIWRFLTTIIRRRESPSANLESPLCAAAPRRSSQSKPTTPIDSFSSGRRVTMLTLSTNESAAPRPTNLGLCLAHPCDACSCAVAQVATMTGGPAWKVMGRRWRTAKFVQAHNVLAARRGAQLATITPPHRPQCSIRALQDALRTPPASPAPRASCNNPPRDAHHRVTMRSDPPRCPRRGAASKLLPLPSPKNAEGPCPVLYARQRKELERMHADLRAAGICTQD